MSTRVSWISKHPMGRYRTYHLLAPNEPARITAKAVSTSPKMQKAMQMVLEGGSECFAEAREESGMSRGANVTGARLLGVTHAFHPFSP